VVVLVTVTVVLLMEVDREVIVVVPREVVVIVETSGDVWLAIDPPIPEPVLTTVVVTVLESPPGAPDAYRAAYDATAMTAIVRITMTYFALAGKVLGRSVIPANSFCFLCIRGKHRELEP